MSEGLVAGLSRVLGDIARSDVPSDACAAAKNRLLHAFGVSMTSAALPAAQTALKTIAESAGNCVVFGRAAPASADDAAFANGMTGHGSLLEDCGPGGLREGSHPGTYIIPAALAAAQASGASGRRFLAGVVVGYETVSRIGAAAPAAIVKRGFRPVGVMGPLGAAAAAAIVLGADDHQLTAALAMASDLSGGATQGIFEGTMEPYAQSGFAARNGLFAARLALAGAVTAKQALEGKYGFFQTCGGEPGDAARLVEPRAQLGICAVGTKRFAACLQNQQTLALIVDGLTEPLTAGAIVRVVIRRPESGTNGLNSPGVSRSAPFANMLSAQMSARFTAAAALLGRAVDDPVFFMKNFDDPQIVELTGRIELVPSQDPGVSVVVELDGRPSIMLDGDKSDVLFPSDATIRSRFLHRVKPLIGAAGARVVEATDRLEDLADLRALTALMTSKVVS